MSSIRKEPRRPVRRQSVLWLAREQMSPFLWGGAYLNNSETLILPNLFNLKNKLAASSRYLTSREPCRWTLKIQRNPQHSPWKAPRLGRGRTGGLRASPCPLRAPSSSQSPAPCPLPAQCTPPVPPVCPRCHRDAFHQRGVAQMSPCRRQEGGTEHIPSCFWVHRGVCTSPGHHPEGAGLPVPAEGSQHLAGTAKLGVNSIPFKGLFL